MTNKRPWQCFEHRDVLKTHRDYILNKVLMMLGLDGTELSKKEIHKRIATITERTERVVRGTVHVEEHYNLQPEDVDKVRKRLIDEMSYSKSEVGVLGLKLLTSEGYELINAFEERRAVVGAKRLTVLSQALGDMNEEALIERLSEILGCEREWAASILACKWYFANLNREQRAALFTHLDSETIHLFDEGVWS